MIAIHAAFNTVAALTLASLPAILVGAIVILACLLVPRAVGPGLSPMPA